MRKSLLLVVALLAIASVMAAMAYTSATVTSAAAFRVTNTDGALLALEAGEHAAASYTSGPTANELVIDWAQGYNGRYGVQSGSVYIWEKLFIVTNNSEKPVKVSIYAPKDSATPEPNIGSKVFLKTEHDEKWVTIASRHTNAYGNKVTFELNPGEDIWIDSKIDTVQRTIAKGDKGFKIVVEAVEIKDAVD